MQRRLFQFSGSSGGLFRRTRAAAFGCCLLVSVTALTMTACDQAHGSPPVPPSPAVPEDPPGPQVLPDPADPADPAAPLNPAAPLDPASPDDPGDPSGNGPNGKLDNPPALTVSWPELKDIPFPELPEKEITLSRSGAGGLGREFILRLDASARIFCAVDGEALSPEAGGFVIRAGDYQGTRHLLTVIKMNNKVPHSREIRLTIVE